MRIFGALALALAVVSVGCASVEEAVVSEAPVVPDAPVVTAAPEPSQTVVTMVDPLPPTGALEYAGELTQGGWIRGRVPPGTLSAKIGDQSLAIAEDGAFFAAFDRDSPASLPLAVTPRSGTPIRVDLSIAPRAWDIERVNVAKGTDGGSAAWWAKREPEWLAINAARAKRTGAEGWKQDFVWPVKGRISGRFGRQRIYRGEPGSYHSGIDIAPGNGAPFAAPADGVVVLARTGFSLEGGIIIVDHGAGLNSAFIHLSKLAVKEGDTVRQGQLLGNVGASGRATGPHLHWSLMWNEARLDPLLFTGPMD